MVLKRRSDSWRIARGSATLGVATLICILTACEDTTVRANPVASVGSDQCSVCHESETRLWDYGPHRVVACERCHGPGGDHVASDDEPRPEMNLGSVRLCLSCHGDSADPSAQADSRIRSFEHHLDALEQEHRIKLDRTKSGTSCVFCHDPHSLE